MTAPKHHGLNTIQRSTIAKVGERWTVSITARDGSVVTGEGASRGTASEAAHIAAALAGIVSRSARVRAREACTVMMTVQRDDAALTRAAGAAYLAQFGRGDRPRG